MAEIANVGDTVNGEKMTFDHKTNKIYLDLDQTLADFDYSAIKIFGMHPEEYEKIYGSEKFWEAINSDPNFFLNLRPLDDMRELYDAVVHLKPTILTGIPRNMDAYENQKHMWCEKHFGKEQKVICCRASKKSQFCLPNDIIVDDRKKYKHLWEKAGGIFVIHKNAKDSLDKLAELGVL